MAKVLISFLGTGKPTERRYRPATYQFQNGEKHESPFIAKALVEQYNIDKVILIGTIKSMWEEVYYTFASKNSTFDEKKWIEIGDVCGNANHESPLSLPHKDKIEQALGKDSKIILIKYGLNAAEIQYNTEQILKIEQYLNSKDELYVDITHSFRSLPLYLMNCLNYIQQVSKKKIEIKDISYGMLDCSIEFGYTPVVSLKPLLDVTEWISGAYSFAQFKNAYKIASLLPNNNKDAKKRLKGFSDAKNLNYLSALETQMQQLSGLKYEELPYIAQLIIEPIVNDFRKELKLRNSHSHSQFQYYWAKWQFDNMNYSAAFITLTEAIITYVCEQEKCDAENKDERDEMKTLIFHDSRYKTIRTHFEAINDCRKGIAHSVSGTQNCQSMIDTLSEEMTFFQKLLK